jgi:hypothetical protein
VDDFEERLWVVPQGQAKKKKLKQTDFLLLSVTGVFGIEPLHLWRKKQEEILTEPESEEGKKEEWTSIASVIKLFKKQSEAPSAEQVSEIQDVKKRARRNLLYTTFSLDLERSALLFIWKTPAERLVIQGITWFLSSTERPIRNETC